MLTANDIRNRLEQSPGGVSCKFIKLSDEWGLKVYRRKGERDRCYDNQSKMAQYGFGPRVGDKLDINDEFYVYVTEVAIPIWEAFNDIGADWIKTEKERAKLQEKDKTIIKSMIRELVDKMADKGYQFCDAHMANVGMLNKMLVCIDFGND